MHQELHPLAIHHDRLAQKILSDHPTLRSRIARNCQIPEGSVATSLREVIRFMNLIAFKDEVLTPSRVVDDLWHEFILFTRPYDAFCQRYFERMIHHQPGGTEKQNLKQYKRTLDLYQEYFNSPDPLYWGYWTGAVDKAQCGSCESPKA
ncbi:MAG: hypothetical protein IEMM0008_1750 [bacterium]|nr:MAG: hypothetical protein IEMM0008_1750 [bacterium]